MCFAPLVDPAVRHVTMAFSRFARSIACAAIWSAQNISLDFSFPLFNILLSLLILFLEILGLFIYYRFTKLMAVFVSTIPLMALTLSIFLLSSVIVGASIMAAMSYSPDIS